LDPKTRKLLETVAAMQLTWITGLMDPVVLTVPELVRAWYQMRAEGLPALWRHFLGVLDELGPQYRQALNEWADRAGGDSHTIGNADGPDGGQFSINPYPDPRPRPSSAGGASQGSGTPTPPEQDAPLDDKTRRLLEMVAWMQLCWMLALMAPVRPTVKDLKRKLHALRTKDLTAGWKCFLKFLDDNMGPQYRQALNEWADRADSPVPNEHYRRVIKEGIAMFQPGDGSSGG
jgi:hypothetical protein